MRTKREIIIFYFLLCVVYKIIGPNYPISKPFLSKVNVWSWPV